MDARRIFRTFIATFAAALFLHEIAQCSFVSAAGYRTTNFTVAAPTPALAKEIGDAAEKFRKELAIEWLGEEMPAWSKRCPIKARVSRRLGAGGATSFLFDQGEVYGWQMNIQGSRIRILDSVLPHEITHTIFASHFRRPLPRWADEGACTTVEDKSEIAKQERMLIEFLQTRRAIPFSQMLTMKEYPKDIMPLYAQGHSVTNYLIQRRGRTAFLEFLAVGMKEENWRNTVEKHYGYENILEMQNDWLKWVREGRPKVALDSDLQNRVATVPKSESKENKLVPVVEAGTVRVASAEAVRNFPPEESNAEPRKLASRPNATNSNGTILLQWNRPSKNQSAPHISGRVSQAPGISNKTRAIRR